MRAHPATMFQIILHFRWYCWQWRHEGHVQGGGVVCEWVALAGLLHVVLVSVHCTLMSGTREAAHAVALPVY